MRRDRVALQTPLGDAAAVVRAVRRVGRVVYMSVGGRGRYKSWSAIKTGWSLWSTSVSIHAHSARATCHLLEERSVVAGARSPGYIRNRNRDGNGDHVRDWLLPPFLAASSRFINKGRAVLKLHLTRLPGRRSFEDEALQLATNVSVTPRANTGFVACGLMPARDV